MQVALAILQLYPDLIPQPLGTDFLVLDNEIVEWNTDKYPEPTPEDLARGDFEVAKHEKDIEFLIHALEEFVDLFAEVKGSYKAVPPELLDEARMAHFFFSLEGPSNPEKVQAAAAIVAKYREARTHRGNATMETTTAEEIRSETWEDVS
jgi:hypothetical protein